MSKRLQVVMDDEEYADIEAIAKRSGESVSVWVRRALREARRQQPQAEAGRKLASLRAALAYEFPTGDIEQILEETEAGYHS
ncbi:ribbon-helix-helix protein, CopG family [Gordonia sp. (in: high G+C Gram-positive bacteria)]|uniref:ribbon-helix-helix protein, CopG family n=1 Tax=Gordonia sp. (in: high G+C Gram-positive bacteria) TaxID=84139 RepID=UPI00260EDC0C|nr:ribbon-helix-helix protein, CopG family [Gordonia sp. (in: high G+C Gram-positive bacteria)]HMS76697.1 ribbon-helix-helix protein, CopG family [Gordonia sp. (in: high G+C Gram-positive bacteria)]HQV18011.1 ribbon-helix-helix protein, CopG family [Gordonia sp. (in: high G+C Gram-positive bacteria)]